MDRKTSQSPPQARFSVIVPVYKVRDYLEECLDSVLDQTYGNLELIAVDDCCPDGCGELVDKYAESDSRVRPLHLHENVGLGLARQAALGVASGEYVLFVDSDDMLTPGTLEALTHRIDATGAPDIVVFDFAFHYSNGSFGGNPRTHLLAETGDPVFTADDRPDLLWLLMVAWNKTYRRDFIQRHDFRFTPGYYEDAPWTYATLLLADRISVLDRVCLHYRQGRDDSILRSRSRKHFDVFDQYTRIFALLEQHPEVSDWHPFLFARMLDHFHTILADPRRLPRSTRAEFFHRCAAHYRRFLPARDAPSASGRRGIRHRLIGRDAYLAYAMFLRANKAIAKK